jgi:hypothetical protein
MKIKPGQSIPVLISDDQGHSVAEIDSNFFIELHLDLVQKLDCDFLDIDPGLQMEIMMKWHRTLNDCFFSRAIMGWARQGKSYDSSRLVNAYADFITGWESLFVFEDSVSPQGNSKPGPG